MTALTAVLAALALVLPELLAVAAQLGAFDLHQLGQQAALVGQAGGIVLAVERRERVADLAAALSAGPRLGEVAAIVAAVAAVVAQIMGRVRGAADVAVGSFVAALSALAADLAATPAQLALILPDLASVFPRFTAQDRLQGAVYLAQTAGVAAAAGSIEVVEQRLEAEQIAAIVALLAAILPDFAAVLPDLRARSRLRSSGGAQASREQYGEQRSDE